MRDSDETSGPRTSGPRGTPPERPRSEPEILPPERGERTRGYTRVWTNAGNGRARARVFIARPGPFSLILALLVIGFIAALALILLLGIVVIWIPLLIVGIVAALFSGTLRRYWQHRRGG